MGLTDWTAYLSAAKTELDRFKGIRSELPTGPKSQQIKEQIDKSEGALKASEAELAKALGYKLCQYLSATDHAVVRARTGQLVC